MAQNPWLEMFDKRRSELHQLEYLRQQIADSQAARAQRGEEFQAGLADNALDRGLRQQQLDQSKAAQSEETQRVIANLLSQGAQKAQPGNPVQPIDMMVGSPDLGLGANGQPGAPSIDANVTLGGQGYRVPSPMDLLKQKTGFLRDQEDQDEQIFKDSIKDLPERYQATYLANYKAKRQVANTSFDPADLWSYHNEQANNQRLSPAQREIHKKSADSYFKYVVGTRAASGSGARSFTPNQTLDNKIQEIVGKTRAYIISMNPGLVNDRVAFAKAVTELMPQLTAEYGAQLANHAMAEMTRGFATPSQGAAGFRERLAGMGVKFPGAQ